MRENLLPLVIFTIKMIKIQLNNGFRITNDRRQFVLWKNSKIMGYFADLECLITAFIKHSLWNDTKIITDIETLAQELKYLKNTVLDTLKPLLEMEKDIENGRNKILQEIDS
jgi:hypothetical protein